MLNKPFWKVIIIKAIYNSTFHNWWDSWEGNYLCATPFRSEVSRGRRKSTFPLNLSTLMRSQCRSSHFSYCPGTALEKRLRNLILHLVVPVWLHYWFSELRNRLLTASGVNSSPTWSSCSRWGGGIYPLCWFLNSPFWPQSLVLPALKKSGHSDFSCAPKQHTTWVSQSQCFDCFFF